MSSLVRIAITHIAEGEELCTLFVISLLGDFTCKLHRMLAGEVDRWGVRGGESGTRVSEGRG